MSLMWHDNRIAGNELRNLQYNFKVTHTEEALIARSVPIMSFMKLKEPMTYKWSEYEYTLHPVHILTGYKDRVRENNITHSIHSRVDFVVLYYAVCE